MTMISVFREDRPSGQAFLVLERPSGTDPRLSTTYKVELPGPNSLGGEYTFAHDLRRLADWVDGGAEQRDVPVPDYWSLTPNVKPPGSRW